MLRICLNRANLSGTLIVPYRSTSSQPGDDFNEFLLLLESMLELVLLRLVPTAHFGKQLHRAELWGVRSCRSSRRRTAQRVFVSYSSADAAVAWGVADAWKTARCRRLPRRVSLPRARHSSSTFRSAAGKDYQATEARLCAACAEWARAQGLTGRAIARELNIPSSNVFKLIKGTSLKR